MTKTIRLQGLDRACDTVQEQLSRAAQGEPSREMRSLQEHISRLGEDARGLLEKSGASLEDLPLQSQRSLLWLRFLSDSHHLQRHVQTLAALESVLAQPAFRFAMRLAVRGAPLRIRLANQPLLFSMRGSRRGIDLVLHEGLAGAPGDVLEALLGAALCRRTKVRLQTLRQYSKGDEFRRIAAALEPVRRIPPSQMPRGRAFDLQDVFRRVNNRYFAGALEMPVLAWSRSISHRTFGRYQPQSDLLVVNRLLDQPGIFPCVVEFIMYHELLHKKLGLINSNGRTYAHTKAFREAERRFEQYDEAQKILKTLAQGKRQGR